MAITDRQYNDIMRGYDERRTSNEQAARERRLEVYARLPEIKAIDAKIADTSSDAAKNYINGDREALKGLKDEIAALSAEKKKLLVGNGYPEDYLEVKYDCRDCKDTGYIGSDKCRCLKQRIINELYQQSSIMRMLDKENFNSFSLEIFDENVQSEMKIVYEASREFVETFANAYRNMLFLGHVGSGKTFMSNCIAKALLDKGYSVLYFSALSLFDTLAKQVFNKTDNEAENSDIIRNIVNADLLIIDDLGTENPNSFVKSHLFLILNERHLRRHSTIISTNLSLQSLQNEYTERITSRLIGGYDIYKFNNSDLRLKLL